MKHLFVTAACAAALLSGCASGSKDNANPFLSEYTTPFQVPPFDKIQMEHYKPAFLQGMEEQAKEIEAIVNNPEEATFENAQRKGTVRRSLPDTGTSGRTACTAGSPRRRVETGR